MRLVIISDMAHYRSDIGIVGWGPTVQEIDHLAQIFDTIEHVACLHPGPAPHSALPYQSNNVRVIGVPPSGGRGLVAKLGILRRLPHYANIIVTALRSADVVHVRAPAHISFLAVLLLRLRSKPPRRWFKYAGNWHPEGSEPWSYWLQRFYLSKGRHRGLVTVNGSWPNQPSHVITFFNPCLTDAELETGMEAAAGKTLTQPLRLLFVGRTNEAKGVGRLMEICSRLVELGVDFKLDLIGDAPQRADYERIAIGRRLADKLQFHGWLPRPSLEGYYRRAHLLVLPSKTEGWPKVLSEGMAHGVVPMASAVGAIPQTLAEFGIGCCLPSHDVAGFSRAIAGYCSAPGRWQQESQAAVRAARNFSYTNYVAAVRSLLALDGMSSPPSESVLCGAQEYS